MVTCTLLDVVTCTLLDLLCAEEENRCLTVEASTGFGQPQRQSTTASQPTNPAAEADGQKAAAAAADTPSSKSSQVGPAVPGPLEPAVAADGSEDAAGVGDYADIVEAFAASVGVKVSDMPPEWAQMVAAAAAAGMVGGASGPDTDAGGGTCADAAGVLTRAPLFTWRS